MKALIAILIVLLLILQYTLWFGDGNMREVWRLQAAIEQQKKENEKLRERNTALEAEVQDLKKGLAAVEERARSELGMIKKGETFYQIVEDDELKDGTKDNAAKDNKDETTK
jgi:cell division protein FtsB